MQMGNNKIVIRLKTSLTSFFQWTSDPSLDKTLLGFCQNRKINNPKAFFDWTKRQYLEWFYESSSVKVIFYFLIILIPFVFWIEKENINTTKDFWIVLLERSEALALISAVILFFKEARNRKRQAHYAAWQVIDNAAGNRSSYARYQALQDLNADKVSLEGLHVPDAYLPRINLKGAYLVRADFEGAKLMDADLTSAVLSWIDLTDANMESVILKKSQSYKAVLRGAKLMNVKLNYSRFDYADFSEGSERSSLNDADFSHAIIRECNFHRASLFGAKFSNTICHSNLSETDLRHAFLEDSDFSNSDLSKANLEYAEIKNTDFKYSDFNHANLRDATLVNVDFENANLSNANLIGVDLSRVNLTNADLSNANLNFFVRPNERSVLAKAKNLPVTIRMQLDSSDE